MLALEITGVVLSLLLLAAHFLRAGAPLLVLAALAMVGLLFVRRRWAARTLQVVLVLGALEWVRTLIRLAAERMREGEPATRMVIILAAVAAVTLLSAIALSRGRLRRLYPVPGDDRAADARGG